MEHLPITLSGATGVPFYRQIVDQAADLIRSGRLRPGAQLPSVRELAASLMVSLITVRRAYADLEAAGLLRRRQGQGTFVAEKVEAASREQALAEARSKLVEAVEHAARLGVDAEELKALWKDLIPPSGDRKSVV